MKNKFWIFMSLILWGLQTEALDLNSAFGKSVGQCTASQPKKHVWIFKQWHLGPKVNTHSSGTKNSVPQEENQTAIFRQIDQWIKDKTLNTVYSEGCTGEITENFSDAFNGWSFKDLSELAKKDNETFEHVVTLIPLKLKAKYQEQIKTLCADSTDLIKRQNSTMSDIRGNMGFLSRIEQLKENSEQVKPYLSKIKELDHLPSNATARDVIARLKKDIDEELKSLEKDIELRNQKIVETLRTAPEESALVIGGLHAQGIESLLTKANIGCTIVEPVGYKDEKMTSH